MPLKPGDPGYGQLATPGTYPTNTLDDPNSPYARRYASAEDQAQYGHQTNAQNAAYRNKEDKFDQQNTGLRTALQDAGDWFMGTNRYKAQPGQLNPNWDAGTPNEVRTAQGDQNEWLRRAMMGQGPSVAAQQALYGQGAAVNAASSRAASARGNDVALANRGAAQGQQVAMAQGSQNAALARATEQMGYAQQYTTALQQERLAQLQAQGLSLEAAKAQLQAETSASQTNATISEGNAERHQKGIGTVATLAGAALSDIAAKEGVQTLTPQSLEEDRRRRQEESDRYYQELADRRNAKQAGGGSGGGMDLGGALSVAGGMLSDANSKAEIARLRAENHNLANALDAAFPRKHEVTMPVDYHPRPAGEMTEDLPRVPAEPGDSPRRMAQADWNRRQAVAPPTQLYPMTDETMASDFTQKERIRRASVGDFATGEGVYDVPVGEEIQPTYMSPERARQGGYLPHPDSEDRAHGRFADVNSREAYAPVDAVSYRYRPEAAARMTAESPARTPEEKAFVYADKRAPRAGIIAQQLEKSPEFRPAVIETPAGKAVVRDRALSTALAQGADLDKRLRELEARTKHERAPVGSP